MFFPFNQVSRMVQYSCFNYNVIKNIIPLCNRTPVNWILTLITPWSPWYSLWRTCRLLGAGIWWMSRRENLSPIWPALTPASTLAISTTQGRDGQASFTHHRNCWGKSFTVHCFKKAGWPWSVLGYIYLHKKKNSAEKYSKIYIFFFFFSKWLFIVKVIIFKNISKILWLFCWPPNLIKHAMEMSLGVEIGTSYGDTIKDRGFMRVFGCKSLYWYSRSL